MKAVILVFTIVIVAVLGEITEEQKAKLKQYKESCIAETGVDTTVVENAKKGEIPENDEKLACFSTCLLKKIGIMKPDGDVDWDVARSKVSSNVPQEHLDLIYSKCQDVAGEGCEKGLQLMKCFMENKKFTILT